MKRTGVLVGMMFALLIGAFAQTSITYQGFLKQNGSPANGTFNMAFRLFAVETGGTALQSSPASGTFAVNVQNGLFTQEISFNASRFTGADRWLEIAVNGTTLSPRIKLNSAPYSIFSQRTRGISVDGENVGIGTTEPLARLHVMGEVRSDGSTGGILSAHNPNNTQSAVSLSWLNDVARIRVGGTGAGASSGLDIQGPGNVSLMRILGDGRVAIGTQNPTRRLEVRTSEITAGYFETTAPFRTGVQGHAPNGHGVVGSTASSDRSGVFCDGRFTATGTKSFSIDHPFDPENKYLIHYCTEGPEPQNVYNGVVRTGVDGYAWIQLPDYFEEVNRDFRYQLTVVDEDEEFALAKVTKKMVGNRFQIRTNRPNVEVCWEVKAVRNDLFVRRHGAPVEVDKPEHERGKYQQPELYDQPKEKGVHYYQEHE
jgi:hypothetical protein